MRNAFLGALIGLALLGGCECNRSADPRDKSDPPTAPSGQIKLVVLIVIDQLPSWTFTRDAERLEGGLGRLLRESVSFPRAEIPFSNTYTAPGHAALATGAAPDRTGVLANGWFRGRGPIYIDATTDREHPLHDQRATRSPGLAQSGASPITLKIEGVSDVLGRARPQARSVSVGIKQRAVILLLGRRVTRAAWYEDAQEAMTCSSFYGEPPGWLTSFNRTNPVTSLYGLVWEIGDGELLARYTGVADDSIGEGDDPDLGFDRSFPHSAAGSKMPAKAIRSMPAAVDYTIALALAAIEGERLGQRGERDLLGLTIGSHDYAGHFWGQESWERLDMLRHIDRALGELFDHLDALVGTDGYAVILTSDHGAVPLVERSLLEGRAARRIPLADLADATNRGLESVLGEGKWTMGYAANSVYTSPEFATQPEARRTAALEAAVAELSRVDGVGFAAVSAQIAGDCKRQKERQAQLACRSIHLDETGDITVMPDRFSLFAPPEYPTGTGHGTPSEECREVPLLVRVPGIRALTSRARVNILQVAPTLSSLLEIDPPAGAEEAPLPLEDGEHPDGAVP